MTHAPLFCIYNFGRLPPDEPPDFILDWSNRFKRDTSSRQVPSPDEWDNELIPELKRCLRRLQDEDNYRGLVRLNSTSSLSAGFAFGNTFLNVGQYEIEILSPQHWRSDEPPSQEQQAPEFTCHSFEFESRSNSDAVVIVCAIDNQPAEMVVNAAGTCMGEGELFQNLVSGKSPETEHNTMAVRQLLTQALGDEELTTLCYDEFRPVYEQAAGMSKTQTIQRLIEYVERHGLFEKLLQAIKRRNPSRYKLHEAKLKRKAPSQFKGLLVLEAERATKGKRRLEGWEAAAMARLSRGTLRDFVNRLKPEKLHLFLAVPLGLAVFLGHYWNAIGKQIQCYEWLGGDAYVRSCLLDLP